MIIKLLIGIIVLIAIYFYMVHMSKSQNHIQEPMGHILEPFVTSNKFAGAKEGYVFKMDSQGLGYYLDRKR